MTDTEDFFAKDGPDRDRYGRPLLYPRGEDKTKPYTRASSLADYLADFSFLWKWKMRYLARSLGQNRDLAMLAGAECYTTGFDKGEERENRESGRRLDDIIERALERGKISEKADYGTVVHALTEPGNDGNVQYDDVTADVASFWAKVEEKRIKIIGTEIFTANDELAVAGTFDHLMWLPGYGICITDKKTSREVHGADFRIQLSTYANADVYDWEDDTRMTLEEFIASKGWDPALLNRDVGFIFHIKGGQTTIERLDLAAGYEAAKVATWVRDNHRKGKHNWPAEADLDEALADARTHLQGEIEEASTLEDLNALWNDLANQAVWLPLHTVAAKRRRTEIEEAA